MFLVDYFGPEYFGVDYFPEVGGVPPVVPPGVTVTVTHGHRRRYRAPEPRRQELPQWLLDFRDPEREEDAEEVILELGPYIAPPARPWSIEPVRIAVRELFEPQPLVIAEKDIADLKKALDQAALWNDLHKEMMANLRPLFLRAILIGAELGRKQKPTRARSKKALELMRGFKRGEVAAAMPGGEAEWLTTTAETYVEGYMDTWWAGLRQTAADALRESILRAIAKGTGVPGVLKDIDSIFGKQRAALIAVTEVTRLMGHGAQLQYTRVGFLQWEWKTANDRRVDPICAAKAAGGPYPMSTAFDPAHPRCRCWPVPSGKAEPKKGK